MDAPRWHQIDRELSWLNFNGRVLEEAADPSVPLLERTKFLAIFSSNLDEFFRVRVAGLRSLLRLGKKRRKALHIDPAGLLGQIHHRVLEQQALYGHLIRDVIFPALADEGLRMIGPSEVRSGEIEGLGDYFRGVVLPRVSRLQISADPPSPDPVFLPGQCVHLLVETGLSSAVPLLARPPRYELISVPSPPLERFVSLDRGAEGHAVMFLDDLLRMHLSEILPDRATAGSWAIKLTRDAELRLEDEFEGDLVDAMRKALAKRGSGVPSRFLYDPSIPARALNLLRSRLKLEPEDLIPGGRYHNLHDLRDLPDFGRDDLRFPPAPPPPHPQLDGTRSVFDVVQERDQLLHIPYQSYDHVLAFFEEAADDPKVEEIWLTVYRVASESRILAALERAARAGRQVHVFFEVQARFDESTNLEWAERLAAAGATPLFGTPDRKVHAKVALVRRRQDGELRNFACLGTGNFNEATARFYADFSLLTADPRLAEDVHTLFRHLAGELENPVFQHLLVAPFDLRERLMELVSAEVDAAEAGETGRIDFKLNALEDADLISALQIAADRGVVLNGIVRGICCLGPPTRGDASVQLRSIVARRLEHARIYRFHSGGADQMYLSSADWMTRNLDHRIEVAFPLYDTEVRRQIAQVLEIQSGPRPRVRCIDSDGSSEYAFPSSNLSDPQEAHRSFADELAHAPAGDVDG